MNIITAMHDAKIFGEHFRRRSNSWLVWEVFLCALFALPMTPAQLAIYQQHTGRTTPPTTPFFEAWLICGRRSGKSFMLAMIAIFLAVFKDWKPYLGPGEVGTIMVIAGDRKQARMIMRYCLGLLKASPMLRRQIESVTRETITLKNNIVVEIHTASSKSTRGYTIVAALLDEISKWPTDGNSAEQDAEVIAALKPGTATIPEAVMLCASSPFARRGVLWQAFDKHYARDDDPILVWKATTREMNLTVPQSFIDAELEADPARNSAEYLAEFRGDQEFVFQLEAVRANVSKGVYERMPEPGIAYLAFVDASAGVANSFAMCIAHFDYVKETIVVDVLREIRAPFSPEAAVAGLTPILKTFGLTTCYGDNYGSNWVKEQFSRFGCSYVSDGIKSKSHLYGAALSSVNSRRVEILDNPRLVGQLCSLERTTVRGGHPTIDAPTGKHEDLANAFAGAVSLLLERGSYNLAALADALPNNDDPDGARAWRVARLAAYIDSFRPDPSRRMRG